VWLSPVAALAVWWSGLSFVNALPWALLLSLCQFTWMLAQSMRLHMGGVQVMLAQTEHQKKNPFLVVFTGLICFALVGFGCPIAILGGLLSENLEGVWPYMLPMFFWKGSACFFAAYSYLLFKRNCASCYSMSCTGFATTQFLALIAPVLLRVEIAPYIHLVFLQLSVQSCLF